MRRALPGQLVRPIMSMTFIMLEPNSATTIITRAINRRDYPVLMGIYLMISVAVAVMTMLVDLIYAWLDPRIRLSK